MVITLKAQEIIKLKLLYKEFIEESPNQYVNFLIKKDNAIATVYNSFKVVINNECLLNELTNLFADDFVPGIGSDEVGTGDVFGPVCVCACYVNKENYQLLKSLNVTDSKALTDEKILEIVPKITDKLVYSLLSVDNKKFNELTNKGYNLNKIKAILHNKALINCQNKLNEKGIENSYFVQDQFCMPNNYFKYLENEPKIIKNIDFHTKGETYHISVAAASLIARYAFIKHFEEIENYVGFSLPKGAGKKVDEAISKILESHDISYFNNIAKLNYNNFKKGVN